jgi:hypothetical protein
MKRSLSQTQAAELLRAASVLPPATRDEFFAAVDSRLLGIRRQLTDDDVGAAIIATLSTFNITPSRRLMCDAAPSQETTMTDDDDPFDERGVLKDGHTARVSIQMRDSLTARDAATRRSFDDSAARYGPGPIYCDRSTAIAAYEDAKRAAENAWRTPTEAADRRRKKITQRDPRGREVSTFEEEEDGAAPRDAAPTVPRTMTVDEARRIKKAAYDEMVAEMCSAYKRPLP